MEMKAQTPIETRHAFAIKILDKLPGLFKPHRYLYHCARCKWSFVVNDGRSGVINPVDRDGNPLPHDEAVKRAVTFALGPCPALQVLNVEPGPIQTSNGNGAGRIDHTRRFVPRANHLLRDWAS
jgi:hypothetical protein